MRRLTRREVADHVANMAREGYSIVEGAIEEPLLAEITVELDRLEQVRPGGDLPPGPSGGNATRRWVNLLDDHEVWQRVATHRWVLQVMQEALGEGFLLSLAATEIVGDGEPEQPIHCVDGIYAFPRPHPTLACNTIWALTDFTEENGATRVVPGSHRWERDPEVGRAYETEPLLMPRGSIAFVAGTTYQGAGHNRSGRDRPALAIEYCNGSMRQRENMMLGIHPARKMTFPRELQDLLGFKMRKSTGWIHHQNPRLEMERHYGNLDPADPYQERRDALHEERRAG